MRAAHWASALSLTLIGALGLMNLYFRHPAGREDPSRPDRGELAPILNPPPRKVPVARVRPELGPVVDLSAQGDTLAILAREGWILTWPGRSLSSHTTPSRRSLIRTRWRTRRVRSYYPHGSQCRCYTALLRPHRSH